MAQRNETGASDATYDLVSALYHAMKAADFSMRAQEDAQAQGDSELAAFFEHQQSVQKELAERARALLSERTGAQAGSSSTKATVSATATAASGPCVTALNMDDACDAGNAKVPARNLEHRERNAEGKRKADAVDEASLESFPASDAPSY